MSVTIDDIIAVGKKSLKNSITVVDNNRFSVNPLNSSNRSLCMSIPVRCYPLESKKVFVIPTFLNFNILEGTIDFCFDKTAIIIYDYDNISCPMILKDNIFSNNHFDKSSYDCIIEEIEINEKNINGIAEFENVKLVSNFVTCGSKPKYNINNESIPMYIENQLTFPNGGKNSKLFYIVNDTFALGTKSKWIISNESDNFKGSLHVYLTIVTPRDMDNPDYLRVNYLYVQIKRKFSSNIGDLISCTGKLYKITANDLLNYKME